jgi:hypothetical protein
MKAVLLSLLVSCNAFGWAQEPEAVLGIKLGAPQGAPNCVGDRFNSPVVCLERKSDGSAHIGAFPFRYATGTVYFHDNRVADIRFWMRQEAFGQMKGVLIERYGQPTAVSQGVVSNIAGASLSSETLTWAGRRMTITAIERFLRVDESMVIFSDNAISSLKAESRRDSQRTGASKL